MPEETARTIFQALHSWWEWLFALSPLGQGLFIQIVGGLLVLAVPSFRIYVRDAIVAFLKRLFSRSTPRPAPTLPRYAVESFIDRHNSTEQNLVQRLQNALALDKAQLVVLHGKGGVGKTALAAKTADELQTRFHHIVWASADGRDAFSLGTFLTEIAVQLALSDWRQLPPDQLEQTVRNAGPTPHAAGVG